MKASVERFARRWWSGDFGWTGRLLSVLLAPASWLWIAVTAYRNRRHDGAGGETIPGLTVVSVGNLVMGGTGKTPVASWIARWYAEAGHRPALIVSGYGRDEKLLHERWTPEIPVFVGRDRVAAARRAKAAGRDVAIVDDGFQHRRIARDLDIVLLAAEDAFLGGAPPRGPYREGPEALGRADAVLITRRTGSAEEARALAARVEAAHRGVVKGGVRLTGGRWVDLDGGSPSAALGDVLAVAAVGHPESFLETVRHLVGGSAELVAFADHHEYTRGDLEKLRGRAGERPIVVTEKDAVKLLAHRDLLGEAYVLEQALEWDWGEGEVTELLASATRVEAT